MLILQNCLHVTKNKNILQQYRVNSFLKHEIENRAFKLRIHFFNLCFFFTPTLMIHLNSKQAVQDRRKNKIHYLSCDSISVFNKTDSY